MREELRIAYPPLEGLIAAGLHLPAQPFGITRLLFGPTPFGITCHGNGHALVVTHVEASGQGVEKGVQVGDHIIEVNGSFVDQTMSDKEFVEILASLGRPVVLGLSRRGMDYSSAMH